MLGSSRRHGSGRAGRAGIVATGAVTLVVAAVLGFAALTAARGPGDLVTPRGTPGFEARPTLSQTPTRTVTEPPPRGEEETSDRGQPAWASAVRAALQVLLVAGLAWVLWRVVRWLSRVRFRRPHRQPGDDPELPPAPESGASARTVADRVVADAEEQRSALRGGTPRNGIVACWLRFEELADRSDVARHPWETPTEFTVRLLGEVAADRAALEDFTRLYREARFSDHELPEDARERAVGDLDEMHRALRRRLVHRGAPAEGRRP